MQVKMPAVQEYDEENGETNNSNSMDRNDANGKKNRGRGGGRKPGMPNMESLNTDDDDETNEQEKKNKDGKKTKWRPSPVAPGEARLTIVQITDVYTLEHFASLRTLLQETKKDLQGCGCDGAHTVISVLTGDFLAPYLLSSVDRGNGMMKALAQTPIDYVTWGNHEADIDHRTVCRHVRQFPGKWLNSNMQSHEAMDAQLPFDVITVTTPDGTHERTVGLVAVLSNDPALYSHFKPPGAFGGATIDDPWDTLQRYQDMLMAAPYHCDVVLPLQHTYVPDDHKTCRQFDFPVVLSGHDHHRVDEVIEGTRLLKPGLDGIYATVLEFSWPDNVNHNNMKNKNKDDAPNKNPNVKARFVQVEDWEPDPVLQQELDKAYDVLLPLRNTELARVPPTFQPLSSVNSRGCVCTMGTYICSLVKSSMNTARRQRAHMVDAVIIMGGNIRGGTEYPEDAFFSLEALESEIKGDETIGVVPMPGWVLADGIAATHDGDPKPGWMQYDDGIQEQVVDGKSQVTHVGGQPLDRDRIYRVATKIVDLTNGQSEPLTEYFHAYPELFPPKGAYVNVHAELMSYFARNLWRKIWEAVAPKRPSLLVQDDEDQDSVQDNSFLPTPYDILCVPDDECKPERRLELLDSDHDGIVSVDDIQTALRDLVGLSVHEDETSLAQFVHSFADTTGTGEVTLEDFEIFCSEMPALYERQKWRLAYPRQVSPPSLSTIN
eukprot:scaffold145101_cov59-Attheya_sp.AAC.2